METIERRQKFRTGRKKLSVYFSPEELAKVKTAAAQNSLSVSCFIAEQVAKMLKNQK
jgi:putative heme degradation protein